jgi:hypothetical protein
MQRLTFVYHCAASDLTPILSELCVLFCSVDQAFRSRRRFEAAPRHVRCVGIVRLSVDRDVGLLQSVLLGVVHRGCLFVGWPRAINW